MSTTIRLRCIDQVLTFESTPVIASGGLGEDYIQVSFCSKWADLTKTAVFWRTEDDVYHVLLDDNGTGAIPPEVLEDEGVFYFGVFGVSADGRQRTTEVLRYNVARGAITTGTKPSDPTPDIYTEILAKCQEVVQMEAAFEKEITDLVANGLVPDGSITTQKLQDGTVTTEKLQDGSVTAEKLAPGAVPDNYTKEQIMSRQTAEMFGLGNPAVPDDALAFLGKYNQHCWRVQHGLAGSGYKEVTTPTKKSYTLHETDSVYGMGGTFIKQYSKEIEFDANGNPSLKNPSNFSRSAPTSSSECEAYANAILSLAPCYITVEDFPETTLVILYIPENATCTSRGNGTIDWYNYPLDNDMDGYEETEGYQVGLQQASSASVPALVVTGEYYKTEAGEVTYEFAPDRNTYPDSGTVDELTYTYLGVPFDNAVLGAKVESGTYTGTGTNGVTLTFQFRPRMVFVVSQANAWWGGSSVEYGAYRVLWADGMTKEIGPSGSYGNYNRMFTLDGNSLSWEVNAASGNSYPHARLNTSGEVYCYIGIG